MIKKGLVLAGRTRKKKDQNSFRSFLVRNRLQIIRKSRGMTLEQLEAALQKRGRGWSLKTINNFENGKANASTELLNALAEVLDVSVSEIVPESSQEISDMGETAPPLLSARFQPGPKLRKVPVVSWAGCGAIGERGLNFTDSANQLEEEVWTDCRDSNAFALIMEGHSMEGEILPGDRVVFAPGEVPRNGDVVVARLAESGGVLVKRYRALGPEGKRIRLESANPEYSATEYNVEDFRFIYPAVDLKRRMRK